MTTYYVATLARYVLVDAENEADARERGHAALHELYADLSERPGREVPINIMTVRPAAEDEIVLWRWHHEIVARERAAGREATGQRITTRLAQSESVPEYRCCRKADGPK